MGKQILILLLVAYLLHMHNPKYYEWIHTNVRNIQMIAVVLVIFLIYRSNDLDNYTKKTFGFFRQLDVESGHASGGAKVIDALQRAEKDISPVQEEDGDED